jgi:hypothetical protein
MNWTSTKNLKSFVLLKTVPEEWKEKPQAERKPLQSIYIVHSCCCNKATWMYNIYDLGYNIYDLEARSPRSRPHQNWCLEGVLIDDNFSCPHVVEGKQASPGLLSKSTSSPHQGSAFKTYIPLKRPHFLLLSFWGLGLQHMNLG